MASNKLNRRTLRIIKNEVLNGIKNEWVDNSDLKGEYPINSDFNFYISDFITGMEERVLLNKVDGNLDTKQIEAYVTDALNVWGKENLGKSLRDVEQMDFNLEVESQSDEFTIIGAIDISPDYLTILYLEDYYDEDDDEAAIDPADLVCIYDYEHAKRINKGDREEDLN